MFIAVLAGWCQVIVCEIATSSLSVHVHRSRIFICRILKKLTKVCPAHRDNVETKCKSFVIKKTPTEPKGSFIIL